jgi:hypothetical protein
MAHREAIILYNVCVDGNGPVIMETGFGQAQDRLRWLAM